MTKIEIFLQRWYWPIIIVFFPFYSSFELRVDLKFYGSIFLMLVCTTSNLIYSSKYQFSILKLVLSILIVFIFINRAEPSSLWVFHFTNTFCIFTLLSQFDDILQSKELRTKVYWAIGIIGILSSIHLILNYWNIDPWFDTFSGHIRVIGGKVCTTVNPPVTPWGFLGNPNHSVMIGVMAAPFMINKRLWWGLPIVIYALYCSWSAMAVVSFVGCMGVMFLLSKTKLLLKALISSVAFIGCCWFWFLHQNYFKFGDRPEKWEAILKFVTKPMGHGLSYFRVHFTTFAKTVGVKFAPQEYWAQAHNEYLDLYVIVGWLIVPILAYFLLRLRPNNKNGAWVAGFTAIMLNSVGNFPWHLPFLALLGIITYSVSCINKESL